MPEIMKIKCVVFAMLIAVFASAVDLSRAVINTQGIDAVLKKKALDNTDLFTIDNFLGEAIREIIRPKDWTSTGMARAEILRRRGIQRQYVQQFSESSYKYLLSGMEEASRFPEERRVKVFVNLLILVDGLEDLRLADLAIARLKDKNTIIRYWAAHCITNDAIIKQLNTGGAENVRVARLLIDRLKAVVDGSGPETIALIARFAADINIPQGEELLLQITDMRIKKYTTWTVEYELWDGTLLKLLDSELSSASGSSRKVAFAARFGLLYSFAIQRYVKGNEILSETQKQQLASVLVETEDKCIGRILEKPQSIIKKAVEQNDYRRLLEEHNRLLGSSSAAGELPTKLNFDYGTTTDGRKRTAPPALPNYPKAQASK